MWCVRLDLGMSLTLGFIHIICGLWHRANFVVGVLCVTTIFPLLVSTDVLSDLHKSSLVCILGSSLFSNMDHKSWTLSVDLFFQIKSQRAHEYCSSFVCLFFLAQFEHSIVKKVTNTISLGEPVQPKGKPRNKCPSGLIFHVTTKLLRVTIRPSTPPTHTESKSLRTYG